MQPQVVGTGKASITTGEIREVTQITKRIAADWIVLVDRATAIKERTDAGAVVEANAFESLIELAQSFQFLKAEQARLSKHAAFVFGECCKFVM